MQKYKAFAKVNIFLKIVGKRAEYHELSSRFVRVLGLFDMLYLEAKESDAFSIVGDFSCTIEQNTIYKAYCALVQETNSHAVIELMQKNAVVVEKRIPAFAGLGGGSSDAAAFLHLCNETCRLGLDMQTLVRIGSKVGADVAFFLHGYESANVSGIGEIVEIFDEMVPELEVFTPNIAISTPRVYQSFRAHFYAETSLEFKQELENMTSRDILQNYPRELLNDLYAPALHEYPELAQYAKDGWFFSGSGSSFFRIKESHE